MVSKLSEKRILIVEDEYFIASDLKRALEAEQATVVGPAGTIDAGIALAEAEPLDAAVLDVNLEGGESYGIADRLTAREIPYLFLTGYDGWALPAIYRGIPRVTKPFPRNQVLAIVAQLCTKVNPA